MSSYTLFDAHTGTNRTYGTMWSTDTEFASWVHPHWRKFSPPDPIYNYLVGIYVGLMGLTGIVGNLITVILFFACEKLRSPSNVLIINLAISDLSFAAINGFPLKTMSAFNQQWTWGKKACVAYGFAGGFFGFVSLTTLAFIALDRYFAIVKPFGRISLNPVNRLSVMLMIIWIWSLMWSIPPFFGYGSYIPEGFHTSCTFDYLSVDLGNLLFNSGMYFFAFLCPVAVIIFSYAGIVKAVYESEALEDLSSSRRHRCSQPETAQTPSRTDLQTVKLSAILVLLYLASWGPYALICFISLLGHREHLTPFTAELPVLFAKSSCMYNPVVYSLMHRNFRRELVHRLPAWFCCCKKSKVRSDAVSTVPKLENTKKINTTADLDQPELPAREQPTSVTPTT